MSAIVRAVCLVFLVSGPMPDRDVTLSVYVVDGVEAINGARVEVCWSGVCRVAISARDRAVIKGVPPDSTVEVSASYQGASASRVVTLTNRPTQWTWLDLAAVQ
ncbi:MAG TPA: hypothetical protein VES67_24125 [Vicinamibacterales bacterium]|nr:hypothetical protein [Vicinamibacterales bacterium]